MDKVQSKKASTLKAFVISSSRYHIYDKLRSGAAAKRRGADVGYGKQGVWLLDAVDGRKEPNMLISKVSDGTISNRGYGKQGVLLLGAVDRRKEANMLISNVSDGTISNRRTRHIRPWGPSRTLLLESVELTSADKHLFAQSSSHAAIRMLSDPVSLEAEGHVSQLDAIAGTPVQENAVRRRGVDSALLKYAGLTLSADQQAGVIYNVDLPPILPGIQAQVTRLAPATFKQGQFIFNEFTLPAGASFNPSSAIVVLVYRKILNFTVYTMPQYQFVGPVVGIISSASNVTSLDPSVSASISLSPNTSINISLPMFSSDSIPNALCAFFASNGSIFISSLASLPNVCESFTLGDFALVVQASSTPSPTQNPPPPVSSASPLTNVDGPSLSSTSSKQTKNWKLVVGATSLALAGLAFLVALVLISIKLVDRCKLSWTRRFTGNEEALQNSLIGNSKAPTAGVMRTKPALEIDMAHFTN